MGKAGIIGMAAVLVLGAVSLPRAWAAPATQAMTAEVQAALDKGDAQHAANLADSALKEGASPEEKARLLLYRGLAQELLGVPAEAMRDFTQALAAGALPPEERAQALLQRGFLRDGLGRLDEAAADYTSVIAMKGDSLATAFNNRANIYRRQNKPAEARRDYLAALSAGGGKPQYSWYGLGQIAEAQHDALAARGYYAKAIAADASYGLASDRLASLGGPPDGAIPDPTTVVLHPPANAARPADGGFNVATEAAKESDGTIVLRAPRTNRDASTAPHAVRVAQAAPPAPSRAPAKLILRPALDQPTHPGRPGSDKASSNNATSTMASGDEVQLGAWRSAAEANAGWAKARVQAAGALDSLSPHVVTADLPGKGRYYRLRVAPGAGHSRTELCAALTAKNIACLPVRE